MTVVLFLASLKKMMTKISYFLPKHTIMCKQSRRFKSKLHLIKLTLLQAINKARVPLVFKAEVGLHLLKAAIHSIAIIIAPNSNNSITILISTLLYIKSMIKLTLRPSIPQILT